MRKVVSILFCFLGTPVWANEKPNIHEILDTLYLADKYNFQHAPFWILVGGAEEVSEQIGSVFHLISHPQELKEGIKLLGYATVFDVSNALQFKTPLYEGVMAQTGGGWLKTNSDRLFSGDSREGGKALGQVFLVAGLLKAGLPALETRVPTTLSEIVFARELVPVFADGESEEGIRILMQEAKRTPGRRPFPPAQRTAEAAKLGLKPIRPQLHVAALKDLSEALVYLRETWLPKLAQELNTLDRALAKMMEARWPSIGDRVPGQWIINFLEARNLNNIEISELYKIFENLDQLEIDFQFLSQQFNSSTDISSLLRGKRVIEKIISLNRGTRTLTDFELGGLTADVSTFPSVQKVVGFKP